jgi:hypothetical protein
MDKSKLGVAIAIVIVAIVVVLVASGQLTFKDNRSAADRAGDAIRALPDGADKAADQLGDRSTGQRIGDQIQGIGK